MTHTILLREDELGLPAFFAGPYPVSAWLRAAAPVYWHAPWQGWVVTRCAGVLAVLHDGLGARLEAAIALQALRQRWPALRLEGGEPAWKPNAAFRGLKTLPVRLG